MKIYIASDHAGYEMKEKVLTYLKTAGYHVEDLGPKHFDPEDDYPDFVDLVAKKVGENEAENKGIILGGTGTGEAIAANRFRHVRAAVFYGGSLEIIRLAREHNDANVISLGARFLDAELAKQAVKLWLDTPLNPHPRHARRIRKIDSLSAGQSTML
jgi:ribose 5-phosphate isomerase B